MVERDVGGMKEDEVVVVMKIVDRMMDSKGEKTVWGCIEWLMKEGAGGAGGGGGVLRKVKALLMAMGWQWDGSWGGEELLVRKHVEEEEGGGALSDFIWRRAGMVLAIYEGRYRSVMGDRAQEDAMRENKCLELLLMIVLRLHHWVRAGSDPLDKADAKAIVSLMECVSVLLVAPGQWQDFVDMCYDLASASLPLTMAQIYKRLDVQAHVRERTISVDALVEEEASNGGIVAPVAADKKQLRTQLKHATAVADQAKQQAEKKRPPLGNLNELRNMEKGRRKLSSKPAPSLGGGGITIQRKVHAKARKLE